MLGTNVNGALADIPNFTITIPGATNYVVQLNALPDISDSKSARYNDEPIAGRSFPLKTYSHSDNRSISVTLHFYIVQTSDIQNRLQDLRALQSATYPRDSNNSGTPYYPPPVCQLQFGKLLGDSPLCAVLVECSVKYTPDVVWIDSGGTYLPMKFDVDTKWDVIYQSNSLPGQDSIFSSGM